MTGVKLGEFKVHSYLLFNYCAQIRGQNKMYKGSRNFEDILGFKMWKNYQCYSKLRA